MADEAFVRAIEEFKAANISSAAVGNDVCSVYKKVKPILTGILPLLKLIPVFGQTISEAVTALMAVLDNICSASPAVSSARG
jgi:hypothetical protein